MGPDSPCCWHSTNHSGRNITRDRYPLIGPGLLMLVDTLLHRSLFFSKNMYEKRVSAEDRAAFAELSYNDHTGVNGLEDFRDAWLNHCRLRADLGENVAYGIRLAGPGAAQRHGAKAGSDAGGLMASALEAMMREQSPPRAGKSRMNPAPSLHPLIPLQQEPRASRVHRRLLPRPRVLRVVCEHGVLRGTVVVVNDLL